MSHADYLELGDYNAICFNCGHKFKASELIKHWQGYYVCPRCWESRQPQDFVRNPTDPQPVPWSQPQPGAVYAAVCSPDDQTAIPRRAIPGCFKPGYIAPTYNSSDPLLD